MRPAPRKPRLKHLGEGAFATVCLSSQKSGELVEDVAIKTMKRQSSVEDSELFAKEVDVLRKISHKNIVAFKSAGKSGGTDFLVQEYIAGGTVRQLILKQMSNSNGKAYSNADCLRWSIDISRALVYLHSGAAGSLILHRDINPDNIMLTSQVPSQSDAKLVDFGLHKSIPGSILTTQDCTLHGELPSLDNPGIAISDNAPVEELYNLTNTTGSLMYMAPEVLLGTRYNEKADIFALGMIMYELFTHNMRLLQVCVQRNKQRSILRYAHRVAKGMRPAIPADMPKPLADIIEACWHQDSKRRPSAAALLAALEKLQMSGIVQDADDRKQQCGCFSLFSKK